jgi:hypothetical protein
MTPQPQYSKTTPVDPRCSSYFEAITLLGDARRPTYHCELPVGHRGAHQSGGTHWTPIDRPTHDAVTDPAPVAPVPDGHDDPPDQDDADSERIRPAALSDLDRLMANVFERWRLIQELANSDPSDEGNCCCRYCQGDLERPHPTRCFWLRANRLVDQAGDRP